MSNPAKDVQQQVANAVQQVGQQQQNKTNEQVQDLLIIIRIFTNRFIKVPAGNQSPTDVHTTTVATTETIVPEQKLEQ